MEAAVFQLVVCAALAWIPCQSEWTNVGEAPPPPEAFRADVDPASIPKRAEQSVMDDQEVRILTPLLTSDTFAFKTRLFLDGWLAQSYTWNPLDPFSRSNGPVGYMDRANLYQLNELYLRVGRELDPTRGCFDIGGQADFLYGTDAEYFQARGFDRKIMSGDSYYRLAIPQAYVTAFVPLGDGTTFQVGKFYAPVGIGTPTAVGGFFPTKSYARLYGEPFTLTGLSVNQRCGDQVTIGGGLCYGWDSWTDTNDGLSGFATASWRSCDHWTRLSLFGIGGRQQDELGTPYQGSVFPSGTSAERWLVGGAIERRLTEKWRAWTQGDWGLQERGSPTGDARWYGVQQGLAFTYNDCLTVALRGEWFCDDAGVRVVPSRKTLAPSFVGTPADYFAVSFGAELHANMWLTIRPELRWDWQRRDDPAAPAAFDDGARDHQFLAVVDVVFRF